MNRSKVDWCLPSVIKCDSALNEMAKNNEMAKKYYAKKAASINDAAEERNTARQFREAKKFAMHQKTSQNLISNEKLHSHFENHFRQDENLPMPPELEHPEESCLRDHLNAAKNVDQKPPTMGELKCQMSYLKNQKCLGVDKVRMESIKYATSSKKDSES